MASRPTPASPKPVLTRPPDARPTVQIRTALIPYDDQRRAQMADYALRHYGVRSTVVHPERIVLHLTDSDTGDAAIAHFTANEPQLGELPGVCAHYLIDQDGTVRQLVPDTLMCRHVIGLNDRALGIEVVQRIGDDPRAAAEQVLARPAQVRSLLELLTVLLDRYQLPVNAVIGHAMANDDPAFVDLLGWRNDHTDWGPIEVGQVRSRL